MWHPVHAPSLPIVGERPQKLASLGQTFKTCCSGDTDILLFTDCLEGPGIVSIPSWEPPELVFALSHARDGGHCRSTVVVVVLVFVVLVIVVVVEVVFVDVLELVVVLRFQVVVETVVVVKVVVLLFVVVPVLLQTIWHKPQDAETCDARVGLIGAVGAVLAVGAAVAGDEAVDPTVVGATVVVAATLLDVGA